MSSKSPEHVPVMLEEVLRFFGDAPIRTFYDGTLGAGGHAKALLQAHPEIELYMGCDRDPEALEIAQETLKGWKGKVEFIHGNFADLNQHLKERRVKSVDGFFLT
jgi:16S rRNA (cytosine1402-N4)-methyltransferase